MNTTNIKSRLSKKVKFKSKNINAKEQGITKRLLEKYKPKGHWLEEAVISRDSKNRVI